MSPTGLRGINAVLGVTERGPIGESILVGSWLEYRRHFGGYVEGSNFPNLCKRTLDRGGKLRIARVAHFTDITDVSTIDGAKAVLALGAHPAVYKISAEPPAPTTYGFLEAASIGAWGNSLRCRVSTARDGSEDKVDITVFLEGYPDLTKTVYSCNVILTQADLNRFNTEVTLAKMLDTALDIDLSAIIYNVAYAFEDGVQDISNITVADYVGDSYTSTGIYTFDNYSDFVKIAVPELAAPELDAALISYVEMRKDCRAILRTPIGITGLTAVDYRNGVGVFNHAAINSWFGSMVYGELEVYDSILGSNLNIPAISDVLGAMSQKDSKAKEWFATAGVKRGTLKNVIRIPYNLGTTARSTEFDQVCNAGINAVINDDTYGPIYWGNRTLWKGASLLKFENVADLLIYVVRTLNPLAKSELFDPNDMDTWKAVYRKVNPILRDLKAQRGIWNYVYEGDQFIDSIQDAVVNSSSDVDNGAYTFYLWIQPKVGMEYLGIKVVVANSGVNLEEVSGQPNAIV